MYFPKYFNMWLGVGYDQGPNQLVEFICSKTSCVQLSYNLVKNKSIDYFIQYFNKKGYQGLLCSTSKSEYGFKFEINIRKAFTRLGLPIICIEDFPGNFRMDEESYVDILIVENNFSKTIYKKGHSSLPKMITCPAVRYDYLRKSKFDFKKIKRKSSNCVLWAGQPEIDSNLSTLKILIPILNKLSVTLLFKAHPADKFYKKAGYLNYLNKLRMPWIDITGHKVDADLFDPVDLVITQFSTFAIEAGFYGIPSLSVLFDSAGKNLLLERTGSIATSTIVNANGEFLQPLISEAEIDVYKINQQDLSIFRKSFSTRQDRRSKIYRELI